MRVKRLFFSIHGDRWNTIKYYFLLLLERKYMFLSIISKKAPLLEGLVLRDNFSKALCCCEGMARQCECASLIMSSGKCNLVLLPAECCVHSPIKNNGSSSITPLHILAGKEWRKCTISPHTTQMVYHLDMMMMPLKI